MKRIRPRVLIPGGFLLALLVGVVVIGQSGVQTAIARRVLADQPGMESSLGRLSIGFNSIEIEQLVVRQGPVSLQLPSAKLEGGIWKLLGHPRHISRLKAHGWQLNWDGTIAEVDRSEEVPVTTAGWTGLLAVLEAGEIESEGWLAPLSDHDRGSRSGGPRCLARGWSRG